VADLEPEICDYCEMGVLEDGECPYCEALYERETTAAYRAAIQRSSTGKRAAPDQPPLAARRP
jgi:hypothetical protein